MIELLIWTAFLYAGTVGVKGIWEGLSQALTSDFDYYYKGKRGNDAEEKYRRDGKKRV